MLRHVKPEPAALAIVLGREAHNPNLVVHGRTHEALCKRRIRSERGIEKEPVHRRQHTCQRIERFKPHRHKTKRTKDAAYVARAILPFAQACERLKRGLPRRIERTPDIAQVRQNAPVTRARGLQILIRRPDLRHELIKAWRVKMTRHEEQHFKRPQQRLKKSNKRVAFTLVHNTAPFGFIEPTVLSGQV